MKKNVIWLIVVVLLFVAVFYLTKSDNLADSVDQRREEKTDLHMAVIRDDAQRTQRELEKGYYVDRQDIYGKTPLHYAHSVRVLEVLFRYEANVNCRDHDGYTPLMRAVDGDGAVVEALLNHGADANVQNDKGMTALHLATNLGHQHIVLLLLAHGANPKLTDKYGRTPRDIARVNGDREMLQLLDKRK
ncbi:MAG: ankyrin repeat domain-containing protein [Armatimonadota bacterium]